MISEYYVTVYIFQNVIQIEYTVILSFLDETEALRDLVK